MSQRLDAHGQPLNRRYGAARISDRAIDELIGLSRGVLADGRVNQAEAEFLARWLDRNRHVRAEWPANVLYDRVGRMLADGVLDRDEQDELLSLLSDITGEGESLQHDAATLSTKLPLTEPLPVVEFQDREFCLTGRFVSGTRRECEQEVLARGGSTKKSPTKTTSYLVIGHLGSQDWIHSTHGRKIERAVQLSEAGAPICLISEKYWAEFILAA